MKRCAKCKNSISKSEFANDRFNKDGLNHLCRTCDAIARGKRRNGNYLVTSDDYNTIYMAQNGKCAICGVMVADPKNPKRGRLCIDHNHLTGKARGLLCFRCNRAIGFFDDNPELLIKAINYLVPCNWIDEFLDWYF